MGEVSESQAPSISQCDWYPERGWIGGYVRSFGLDRIEPWCVIDSLTYGVGRVDYTNRLGGARSLGIRPLWPDEAKVRDFADFYKDLEASISVNGVRVPILLWEIKGKYYVRYGASRLYVLRKLGREFVPAMVCKFDQGPLECDVAYLNPIHAIAGLGTLKNIGLFEFSHEKLDIHNVEPY